MATPIAMPDDVSRSELRQDLEKVIRDLKKGKIKMKANSPVSLGHLIVIALVTLTKASTKRLGEWLEAEFPDFGFRYERNPWAKRPDTWQLHMELTKYELPIKCVDESILYHAHSSHDVEWALTSIMDARCFVQRLIKDVSSGCVCRTFDFLSLTPELRNEVYKMVLCLPRGGIHLGHLDEPGWASHANVFSRNLNDGQVRGLCWDVVGPRLRPFAMLKVSLQQHLALLSVNRQISQEAIGVFYSSNTFVCKDTSELHYLLHNISRERRKCIKSVFFRYGDAMSRFCGDERAETIRSFEMLKTISALRNLTVVMSDEQWTEPETPGWVGGRYQEGIWKPAFIRGMAILTSMPGLTSVTLLGPCPRIVAYWKALLGKSSVKVEHVDEWERIG